MRAPDCACGGEQPNVESASPKISNLSDLLGQDRRRLNARIGYHAVTGQAARSVELSSDKLGIIARIDLLEGQNGAVVPVDTKKGRLARASLRADYG
jgi:hypothetical protein